jgi:hypothetical protein
MQSQLESALTNSSGDRWSQQETTIGPLSTLLARDECYCMVPKVEGKYVSGSVYHYFLGQVASNAPFNVDLLNYKAQPA